MDLKTASEDLQIVKMLISQWVRKYGVSELEHILVMDKLDAVASELAGGDSLPADMPAVRPAAVTVEKETVEVSLPADEDDLPTISGIEQEIILHETGELPADAYEPAPEKARSDREALKSLYYDDEHADGGEEKKRAEKTLGDIAHEINDTETFNDRFADELLVEDYESRPVLGEVINSGAKTVGDSFTPQGNDVVAGINGKSGLRKSIGLNDKYLLIRDLFRGDTDLYDKTIDDLEEFTDLNDAMLYIHDNFQWDPGSEGSKMLVELLVNKLS